MVRELDTNVTSSGLTFEEEELFENRYNAELAYNRVQLCINEIEKFQRYNKPDCPEGNHKGWTKRLSGGNKN